MSSPRDIAPPPFNPARSGGDAAATRLWRYAMPRHAPLFAVLAFSLAVAFAFSPNLLSICGIHNDYEMLNLKSVSLFHAESEALFAIARPVAAPLTNLPMLAVQSLSDYRWTRLFSVLTMCVLGAQLMSICIHRLRTRVVDALAIALATLLVLPFIYSSSMRRHGRRTWSRSCSPSRPTRSSAGPTYCCRHSSIRCRIGPTGCRSSRSARMSR